MTCYFTRSFGDSARGGNQGEGVWARLGRLSLGCLALAAALLLAAPEVVRAAETKPAAVLDFGEKPDVRGLAVSPDGNTLAVLDNGKREVTLWDMKTRKQTAILRPKDWSPGPVAFTPDGASVLLYGSSFDKEKGVDRWSIDAWDVTTQKKHVLFVFPPDVGGHWLLTPDGKSLVIGTRTDRIHVFDLETGKESKTLHCDESPLIAEVRVLALAPDGKTLAVGTRNSNIFVFDLEKGKALQKTPYWQFEPGPAGIDLLTFSPDGKRLAAASWVHPWVQIWDPTTGTNLDALRVGHAIDGLRALAHSPDSQTLAMGGFDSVDLWDVKQFGFRKDFIGHAQEGEVDYLVFTPDGKTLISAGHSATVMFWDVPAGAPKDVRRDMSPPYVIPPGLDRTRGASPP